MFKLFVYGTLMEGERLDNYLHVDGAERKGNAEVHGFTLYGLRHGYKGEDRRFFYPVAVKVKNISQFINGEVWDVDERLLRGLIGIESEGGLHLHVAQTNRGNIVYLFAMYSYGLEWLNKKWNQEEQRPQGLYIRDIVHLAENWKGVKQ